MSDPTRTGLVQDFGPEMQRQAIRDSNRNFRFWAQGYLDAYGVSPQDYTWWWNLDSPPTDGVVVEAESTSRTPRIDRRGKLIWIQAGRGKSGEEESFARAARHVHGLNVLKGCADPTRLGDIDAGLKVVQIGANPKRSEVLTARLIESEGTKPREIQALLEQLVEARQRVTINPWAEDDFTSPKAGFLDAYDYPRFDSILHSPGSSIQMLTLNGDILGYTISYLDPDHLPEHGERLLGALKNEGKLPRGRCGFVSDYQVTDIGRILGARLGIDVYKEINRQCFEGAREAGLDYLVGQIKAYPNPNTVAAKVHPRNGWSFSGVSLIYTVDKVRYNTSYVVGSVIVAALNGESPGHSGVVRSNPAGSIMKVQNEPPGNSAVVTSPPRSPVASPADPVTAAPDPSTVVMNQLIKTARAKCRGFNFFCYRVFNALPETAIKPEETKLNQIEAAFRKAEKAVATLSSKIDDKRQREIYEAALKGAETHFKEHIERVRSATEKKESHCAGFGLPCFWLRTLVNLIEDDCRQVASTGTADQPPGASTDESHRAGSSAVTQGDDG